uniref:SCP domain-containing protein n=2 Tax=Mesocestoides corti TaxID=53468 RepID=A0A5K3EPG6_MESCO
LGISWCAVPENNTDQDRADILEEHTSARGNVTPSASKMRLMRYSVDLENLAMKFAANCTNQSANSTLLPGYTNISVSWVRYVTRKPTYNASLIAFNNPSDNYNYTNNTCNGTCALYIQFVWENTTEVGCGMSRCDQSSSGNAADLRYLVACAYHPPAKITGLRPYSSGNSCSACPQDFSCYRNQCVNDTSLLPNTTTIPTTGTAITTTTTDINTTTSVATTMMSTLFQVVTTGILLYSSFKLLTSP